jgi:hypothetical protein
MTNLRLQVFALAVASALLLASGACKSNDGATDGGMKLSCPVGDLSQPIEIQIVHRTVDGGVEVTSDQIPLIEPPQGGKVVFVGVRARNLDGCPVIIQAALRDLCDQSIISNEQRPIVLSPTGDGWLEPQLPGEIINYANLPACPAAGATRNVQGEQYELIIKVTDKMQRTATQTVKVRPFCAEPNVYNMCLCECQGRAMLGAPCPANFDAGASNLGCTQSDGGSPHDAGT